MVQQIRKHGAYDHMPSGGDAMPWIGTYPRGATGDSQGIHMVGVIANRPDPSLGSQSGSDAVLANGSNLFTSASGRFTAANTGGTITITDMVNATTAIYTFTVTYLSATTLTLSSVWAGSSTTGGQQDPWVLTGQGPSNAGMLYVSTDETPSFSGGIEFNSGTYGPHNVGDWLDVTTNSATAGLGMSFSSTGGDILLNAPGHTAQVDGGTINLQSTGGMSLLTLSGTQSMFLLSNANSTVAGIQARLLNHGARFIISDNTPIEQFSCTPQATTGIIFVNDSSGNPLFRVDNDGSLHGKTGQALTFDL